MNSLAHRYAVAGLAVTAVLLLVLAARPSLVPAGTALLFAAALVGVAMAITLLCEGRRRARVSLEAAVRDAEAASRAKDEFLAMLSHELRTPLHAMLGWARLLRTGTLDEATKERALETLERNTRLQAQLIEDLLDVSRIITGTLRIDVHPVAPASAIAAALEAVRPAADAKAVRLEAHADPAAGPVSGDADRLQQVVWNLLSNAIKFTPRGGRVEVRLEAVDGQVRLQVADTGRGISAEFLPHLFERFRQAEGPAARSIGGLGLGLAIVRHLVEMHGGTVRADSAGEGRGATFTVELPMLPAGDRV
jgi:signal transduction histidine kinase